MVVGAYIEERMVLPVVPADDAVILKGTRCGNSLPGMSVFRGFQAVGIVSIPGGRVARSLEAVSIVPASERRPCQQPRPRDDGMGLEELLRCVSVHLRGDYAQQIIFCQHAVYGHKPLLRGQNGQPAGEHLILLPLPMEIDPYPDLVQGEAPGILLFGSTARRSEFQPPVAFPVPFHHPVREGKCLLSADAPFHGIRT